MRCYALRNKVIEDMGFASYAEYLRSGLWRSIRARVLKRAKNHCHICHGAATQVHHRRYYRKVMEGKWLSHLNAVCATCHELGEFDDDGQKVDLYAANDRLSKFRTPRPGQCPQCKKNPLGKGRSLCRKCRRAIACSHQGGSAQGGG